MFSRRLNPSPTSKLAKFLAMVAGIALLPASGIAASFTMGPAVDYTEGQPAVNVLPSFSLTDESQNYAGKNITFELDGSYDAGEVLALPDTEGDPSIVAGAISVKNGTIFKGNGTTASAVGNIDPTLNGQANDLRVNFTNAFTNGDFSQGTTGWSISNARTYLGYALANGTAVTTGASEIGGWPAPVDRLWGPGNQPTSGTTLVNRDRVNSPNSFSTSASTGKLVMTVGSATCEVGFCVIRGPHVISDSSVYLAIGDTVSFSWIANAGTDAFDVYGYLLNTSNGKAIKLIDETGREGANAQGAVSVTLGSARDTTAYYTSANSPRRLDLVSYIGATPTVNQSLADRYDDTKFTDGSAVEAGTYRFVFIAGAYDDSGGKVLGANFTIDDVAVSSSSPATVSATDIQTLVRMLQYSNNNAGSSRARTLTYTSSIPDTGAASTINLTAVNDAPVLATVATQTITDTPATDTFTNVTGTLSATDEESDPITYGLSGASVSGGVASLTNALGTMAVNTSTGAFTFTPNSQAINALSANTTILFTFTATDGTETTTRNFSLNFVGVQEDLPGAPTISSITEDSQSLTINFTAPSDPGTTAITNYKYSTDGTTYLALSPASDASPIEIVTESDGVTPLSNGTQYSVTIKAVNSTGDSPASNAVSATPRARPVAAPAPVVTPSPTPRPTRSPSARPSPSPAASPAPIALPSPSPSPTIQPTEVIQEQVRQAEQLLVNPVRPAPTVAQFLRANPEVGEITDLGFVAVNPTQSLAIRDGVPEPVELFPNDTMTGYVIQGQDFRLALEATTVNGSAIEMDSEGNIILAPSQTAQVEGVGFASGSKVVVWMFSEPVKLGELTTNTQGSFQGSLPLPENLETGKHTIQINGVTTEGETRSVSLGVIVQETPAPLGTAINSDSGILLWLMVALALAIIFVAWLIARKKRTEREPRRAFAS